MPPEDLTTLNLLVDEIRRGQDQLREGMVSAQRETTAAIGSLTAEMRELRQSAPTKAETVTALADLVGEVRELRQQAPGKLSFYLASAVVGIALLCVLGLLFTKGVDLETVTKAARNVTPALAAPSSPLSASPAAVPAPE